MQGRKKLWFRYNYGGGSLEAHKSYDGGLILVITEKDGTPQEILVQREYVSNIIEWLSRAFPAPKREANVIRLADPFPIPDSEEDPSKGS